MTTLKESDIASLSGVGWVIKPPTGEIESSEEELFRLLVESDAINKRVKVLLTEGAKVTTKESDA